MKLIMLHKLAHEVVQKECAEPSRLAALPLVEGDNDYVPIHPRKRDPRNAVEIHVTSINTR